MRLGLTFLNASNAFSGGGLARIAANALPLLLGCASMPWQKERRERVSKGSTGVYVASRLSQGCGGVRDESAHGRIASLCACGALAVARLVRGNLAPSRFGRGAEALAARRFSVPPPKLPMWGGGCEVCWICKDLVRPVAHGPPSL